MRFFEDLFEVDPNWTIGITSLLSNITTREGSHKGGWARLLKCQLINMGYKNVVILSNKDLLNYCDVIIFDLGAEYSGSLNLFGGLDYKVYSRLKELYWFEGPMFSWKHELPDVNVLESRRKNESTCDEFKRLGETFLTDLAIKLNSCKVFDHAYKTDKLLIGDSHTPSVWTPEFMIERRDGRTLKGMIENNTINKYLLKFNDVGIRIKELMIHCSSIDIRHHVLRDPNYKLNILNMVHDINKSIPDWIETATFISTMGIEDESRELPKTGYFKGSPFFGSWEQRNEVRNLFNSCLKDYSRRGNWEVIDFPEYFFDDSGKLKFEVMEKPGSVHISPEYYKWDLDNNKARW